MLGVVVCAGFPEGDEPFESMIARSFPVAAVNGSYFDKKTHHPIGDVRVNGQDRYRGLQGTAMMIDARNNVSFKRVPLDRKQDWSGYETVLACGPALMLNGRVDVDFKAERFKDSHVVGKAGRMGVGRTASGKLLIVQVLGAVSFYEEANIFQALGCYEAMNLDAGASTGMYAFGKFYAHPSRNLSTVFGVWIGPGA